MSGRGGADLDALIFERCLSQAVRDERAGERLRGGIAALLGSDRILASVATPALLAHCDAGDRAYVRSLDGEARAEDLLAASAVLAWSSEASVVYGSLREAHDRAISESRIGYAVGARERLAHHALLFGDLAVAREAIGEAILLASRNRAQTWLAWCTAFAARIACDSGDREQTVRYLEQGRSLAQTGDERAWFARTEAQHALETGDEERLAASTGPQMLTIALGSEDADAVASAAIAIFTAGEDGDSDASRGLALRRALLMTDGTANAVELFAIAAKYGDPNEDARLATHALEAVLGANRRYLIGHAMLARAHLASRSSQARDWVDDAAGAALSFNAIGMRRWTNEAMMLLVRQEGAPSPPRRSAGSGSALTDREQQIAQLIRRGARNREVAAALEISEHTVERHVSSILGRLGLRSRFQIADREKPRES